MLVNELPQFMLRFRHNDLDLEPIRMVLNGNNMHILPKVKKQKQCGSSEFHESDDKKDAKVPSFNVEVNSHFSHEQRKISSGYFQL
jgi:hypothetical protein